MRSTTRHSSARSRLRCCAPDSAWSKMTSIGAALDAARARFRRPCPCPRRARRRAACGGRSRRRRQSRRPTPRARSAPRAARADRRRPDRGRPATRGHRLWACRTCLRACDGGELGAVQARARRQTGSMARASNAEMLPTRPVPSGCRQKRLYFVARLAKVHDICCASRLASIALAEQRVASGPAGPLARHAAGRQVEAGRWARGREAGYQRAIKRPRRLRARGAAWSPSAPGPRSRSRACTPSA